LLLEALEIALNALEVVLFLLEVANGVRHALHAVLCVSPYAVLYCGGDAGRVPFAREVLE